jgi:hypothetical protein
MRAPGIQKACRAGCKSAFSEHLLEKAEDGLDSSFRGVI